MCGDCHPPATARAVGHGPAAGPVTGRRMTMAVNGAPTRLRTAEYLGGLLSNIPPASVRQYRREGVLPGKKIGGSVRFSIAEVQGALSAVRTGGDSVIDLEREPLRDAAYIGMLFGVDASTVERHGRVGLIPRIKIGRHVRFIVADVLDALG